jgi:hypothetical protein
MLYCAFSAKPGSFKRSFHKLPENDFCIRSERSFRQQISLPFSMYTRFATIAILANEIGLRKTLFITPFKIDFAILHGGIACRLLSLFMKKITCRDRCFDFLI